MVIRQGLQLPRVIKRLIAVVDGTGSHLMDAFLTCGLVVDTGTNALGCSLERARDLLRTHTGMSEVEICSETLRYSCDMPAPALAYELGDTELLALRDAVARSRYP